MSMRKVQDIERQIEQLSREEFAELREWMLERDWSAWDEQVGKDLRRGKLADLVSEAQAEDRAGKIQEL